MATATTSTCPTMEVGIDDDAKETKPRVFQCSGFQDCTMTFTRSEHLARHIRKHTGERPYNCAACGRNFSRLDNLRQHKQTVHANAYEALVEEVEPGKRKYGHDGGAMYGRVSNPTTPIGDGCPPGYVMTPESQSPVGYPGMYPMYPHSHPAAPPPQKFLAPPSSFRSNLERRRPRQIPLPSSLAPAAPYAPAPRLYRDSPVSPLCGAGYPRPYLQVSTPLLAAYPSFSPVARMRSPPSAFRVPHTHSPHTLQFPPLLESSFDTPCDAPRARLLSVGSAVRSLSPPRIPPAPVATLSEPSVLSHAPPPLLHSPVVTPIALPRLGAATTLPDPTANASAPSRTESGYQYGYQQFQPPPRALPPQNHTPAPKDEKLKLPSIKSLGL